MCCHQRRLNDVFPDAISGKGIFHYLELLGVPWQEDSESAPLDLLYHINRSGTKFVSPLVDRLVPDEGAVAESVYTSLAQAIKTMYGMSWTKLYATLSLEYNPISNYDMVENEEINTSGSSSTTSSQTRTDNLEHTRIGNNKDTESGTVGQVTSGSRAHTIDTADARTGSNQDKETGTVGEKTTDTGTVDVSGSQSNSGTQNVYGFNSSSAVPSDTQSSSGTSTNKTTNNLAGSKDETRNLTVDHTVSETLKRTGSESDEESGSQDETRNLQFGHTISESMSDTGTQKQDGSSSGESAGETKRQLTRSGNIGVTTSQQMIQSERELWLWRFFDQVFSDLDSILTIPIY